MDKIKWYRTAAHSLGLGSLVRLQLQKRFGGKLLKLTSRLLSYPVYARRHSSDLMVFDQIFVEREYCCLDEVRRPAAAPAAGAAGLRATVPRRPSDDEEHERRRGARRLLGLTAACPEC
jgi:hypothetical protein